MKNIKTSLLTLGATLIAASSLFAATAYMDPVGAVVVTCLGSSDTRVAAPFADSPDYVGTVASISGNDITMDGASFTADEFAGTHYVLVGSASGLEGDVLDITSNTADTVTVDGDISALSAGDNVSISPHWTFGTLLGDQLPDTTEVLLYDSTSTGTNKGPMGTWTYYAGYGWYDPAFNPADGDILYVRESFVIRNKGADTDIVLPGNVPMNNTRNYVQSADGNDQDNFLGLMCPVAYQIGNTGLGVNDNDLVLVPNNGLVGQNKGPLETLTYYAGYGWYDGAFNPADDYPLDPGVGYIYRKAGQGVAETDTATGTVPY